MTVTERAELTRSERQALLNDLNRRNMPHDLPRRFGRLGSTGFELLVRLVEDPGARRWHRANGIGILVRLRTDSRLSRIFPLFEQLAASDDELLRSASAGALYGLIRAEARLGHASIARTGREHARRMLENSTLLEHDRALLASVCDTLAGC